MYRFEQGMRLKKLLNTERIKINQTQPIKDNISPLMPDEQFE